MASIERTAYPRLKANFMKSELRDFYTPSLEELFFVRETARKDEPQLHLLVQLKTFQRLDFFPSIEDVSETIVAHLRSLLRFSKNIIPVVILRTLYRHQNAVRGYLKVKSYDKTARRLITRVIAEIL